MKQARGILPAMFGEHSGSTLRHCPLSRDLSRQHHQEGQAFHLAVLAACPASTTADGMHYTSGGLTGAHLHRPGICNCARSRQKGVFKCVAQVPGHHVRRHARRAHIDQGFMWYATRWACNMAGAQRHEDTRGWGAGEGSGPMRRGCKGGSGSGQTSMRTRRSPVDAKRTLLTTPPALALSRALAHPRRYMCVQGQADPCARGFLTWRRVARTNAAFVGC